jgi:3-isopropylmalate dehydrogenase
MTHKVGIIGGDGIGPEVIAEGLKVIAAANVELETVDYDLGGARYLRDGEILSDSTLDEWRGLDAIYLGAVGTPGGSSWICTLTSVLLSPPMRVWT